MIPIAASYLENICSKCHLSSLTNMDGGYYYFACRCMVMCEASNKIYGQ
jgi:hypothetical protein